MTDENDDCDPIVVAEDFRGSEMTVADAALVDDAEILTDPEPAADENRSLDDFGSDGE